MSAPDMEVIKEIPGYKVILKAVLKTQIQQLVEQLATHTDEESVILTASVSDGTLSHLGSDSGKGFLEDNEDVKSQFLGFCLKRHHKQKQAEQAEKAEKERERQQQLLESAQAMPVPTQLGYGFGYRRNPRGPFPRQNMPRPPGMPPGGGIRSPSQRFEPYPMHRPQRNSTSSDPGQLSMPTTPIKLEPSELSNDGVSDLNVTKSPHTSGLESKDDEKSNSSTSTIPTDLTEGSAGEKQQGDSDLDPNVSVKVEAITESEMELEITGVEPGRPIMPQNWDPNVSMGMTYDPNSGATGSPGDMQQSYTVSRQAIDQLEMTGSGNVYPESSVSSFDQDDWRRIAPSNLNDSGKILKVICGECGKGFSCKAALDIHYRTHSKERPFQCEQCSANFTTKSNLTRHVRFVHNKELEKFDATGNFIIH